jgi:hypothetical protein
MSPHYLSDLSSLNISNHHVRGPKCVVAMIQLSCRDRKAASITGLNFSKSMFSVAMDESTTEKAQKVISSLSLF